MILCLETATMLCSVALCDKDRPVFLQESEEVRSHASSLTIFADNLLKTAGITFAELDAVAVSKGPGSYTGLRIGVSTAKGIAYAASIPLIGIDTLLSMYTGFIGTHKEKYHFAGSDLFCPMIDAMRMEVYYSVFDSQGSRIKEIRAEIIDKKSFSDLPEKSRIFFFGTGASKCKEVLQRNNIIFDDDFRISAASLQKPAYKAFTESKFEDVAYFEPFYLKDFYTEKPVKNILSQ